MTLIVTSKVLYLSTIQNNKMKIILINKSSSVFAMFWEGLASKIRGNPCLSIEGGISKIIVLLNQLSQVKSLKVNTKFQLFVRYVV